MINELQINKPSTVYVKFSYPPRKFNLFRIKKDGSELEYERFLDGKVTRIKFNVPNIGKYKSNILFDLVKVVPLEKPKFSVILPPFERSRMKDFKIVFNPDLDYTPARIDTERGIIEEGKNFYQYSHPTRVFFRLHEIGHFYYKTEKFCDLFATYHFLQMGYNKSTAMYCLTNVLRRNKQNLERIMYVYDHLIKS